MYQSGKSGWHWEPIRGKPSRYQYDANQNKGSRMQNPTMSVSLYWLTLPLFQRHVYGGRLWHLHMVPAKDRS